MEKNQYQALQTEIKRLGDRVKELESQPIKFPISPSSIGALNQSFFSTFFERFNVRRLILTAGESVNPTVDGEMVYHKSSNSIKVRINGSVKTITVT